ncbi:MAG: sugar ABC transporter permease, partial [Dinoroseobacter sp.]|nr:sugar ABC transporter permease [Dinoroseobacter sp.]
MTSAVPPTGAGPLAKREARLAWGLLFPTIFSVSLVVILPLLAIFWVSFKPIGLEDLRPPETVVREQLRGRPSEAGDDATLRYRVRNSSQKKVLTGVTISDTLPEGLTIVAVDERCTLDALSLFCDLGDFEGGQRENIEIDVKVSQAFLDADPDLSATPTKATGRGDNILTNSE